MTGRRGSRRKSPSRKRQTAASPPAPLPRNGGSGEGGTAAKKARKARKATILLRPFGATADKQQRQGTTATTATTGTGASPAFAKAMAGKPLRPLCRARDGGRQDACPTGWGEGGRRQRKQGKERKQGKQRSSFAPSGLPGPSSNNRNGNGGRLEACPTAGSAPALSTAFNGGRQSRARAGCPVALGEGRTTRRGWHQL